MSEADRLCLPPVYRITNISLSRHVSPVIPLLFACHSLYFACYSVLVILLYCSIFLSLLCYIFLSPLLVSQYSLCYMKGLPIDRSHSLFFLLYSTLLSILFVLPAAKLHYTLFFSLSVSLHLSLSVFARGLARQVNSDR